MKLLLPTLLFAFTPGAIDLDGVTPLVRLKDGIARPPDGGFQVESHSRWDVPTAEEEARSLAHARAITLECLTAGDPENERLLARLRERRDPADYRPSVIDRNPVREVRTSSQRVLVNWPHWTVATTMFHPEANLGVTTHTYNDRRGRTQTQFGNGKLKFQQRHPMRGLLSDAEGALFAFQQISMRADSLLEFAGEAGTFATPSTVELRVSLRSLERIRQLTNPFLLPFGYGEYPGEAALTYVSGADSDRLTIRWYDCAGALTHEDEMVWSAPDQLPSIRQRDFLPGAERVLLDLTYVSVPLHDQLSSEESFHWAPLEGSPVEDFRFGATIRYSAKGNDELPGDAELLAYLEQQLGSWSTAPRTQSAAVHAPEVPPEPVGDGAGPLRSLERELDLGQQTIGTRVPFHFTLENTGAEPLQLGAPEGDCTCVNVGLSRTVVPPGGRTLLSGSRNVKSFDRETSSITIPYGEGRFLVVEIVIRGRRGINLPSRSVYAVRDERDEQGFAVQLSFGLEACPDAVAPELVEVEGDLVGMLSTGPSDFENGWLLSGTVWPERGDLFGALEARLIIETETCGSESVTVLADLPPPDISPAAWPSTRIPISPSQDDPTQAPVHTLELPELSIEAASLVDEGGGPRVSFENLPGGGARVTADFRSHRIRSDADRTSTLQLETDHGFVRVVYLWYGELR